ncbi:MAG: uncharacterized protein QOJ86_1500 [Bradyrhizobium sp.]|nr:uncharacterized protein [Bradyrhizobium sp.]
MMSALGLDSFTSASMLFLVGSAFVAGLARGFSGFGSALIFIPLASSMIGAKLASPLLLVIDFIAAAPLIPNGWQHADRRDVGTMLLGSFVGVPIGAWALTQMDPLAVRWMIVALVVPMLALLMSGLRYRGTPTPTLTAGVGAIAGFFNGVAQVGGPPIVLYWLRDTTAARIVRANIIVFFAASSIFTIFSYLIGGVLTVSVVGLAVLTGPAFGIGLWLGSRMFGLASEETFRRICYALIALAALVSLPLFDGWLR